MISYRTIYWICAAVIVASAAYLLLALRGAAQRQDPAEAGADVSGPSDTVLGDGL